MITLPVTRQQRHSTVEYYLQTIIYLFLKTMYFRSMKLIRLPWHTSVLRQFFTFLYLYLMSSL